MYEQQTNEGPQQPEDMPYAPYGGGRHDKADLLDKIRPDAIVDTIRHKLMGEDLIEGKWQKNPYLLERSISPTGAWEIANLMLTVSSQNVALSNLKDKEIRRRTMAICDAAMEMCIKNWEGYGIKGIDQLRFIYEMVFSNTFITLKQPENNGIKRLIQGTTLEFRNINSGEEKDKGIFSNLFKMKGNK